MLEPIVGMHTAEVESLSSIRTESDIYGRGYVHLVLGVQRMFIRALVGSIAEYNV
jgi:hypothetical protein